VNQAPLKLWSEELPSHSDSSIVTLPLSALITEQIVQEGSMNPPPILSCTNLPWGVLYFNSIASAYITTQNLNGRVVGGETIKSFLFNQNYYLNLLDLDFCDFSSRDLTTDISKEFMDLFPLCDRLLCYHYYFYYYLTLIFKIIN